MVGGSKFGLELKERSRAAAEEYVHSPFLIQKSERFSHDSPSKEEDSFAIYTGENLVPANCAETLEYYKFVKDAIPFGCYWFYVSAYYSCDMEICPNSECLPVYHFGNRKFFSGRKGFDWMRNGGTVYKILSDN